MRDLLTGLAIILIVVLTTALVAPYFVDWNNQRTFLETQLSRTLGQKVTIGGNIDLKLLPTPYLILDQTVIGGDDGPVRIGIHHLDLELSVTPLFYGEFDVVEALLEEPTIRVALQADRTLPRLPSAPAFTADVRFDRIAIADGTLAVTDPETGHTFVFDHFDITAEAPSLAGPYKISGAEGAGDTRTKFRFATTTAQAGRMRAHLAIEENLAHAGIDLDGELTLAATPDSFKPSFEGTTHVAGHLWGQTDTPIAWQLSGPLKADPTGAKIDGGEMRIGSEAAGVTLKTNVAASLDASASLTADLSASQLDLDRLSGAPIDAAQAPAPPKLPDLASLRELLAAAAPPVSTKIDVAIDNATYGGEALSDLQAHVDMGSKGLRAFKLAGDGPGGLHLDLAGALPNDAKGRFDGTVSVSATNLPRALDWLGSVDPDFPLKPRDLPFNTVAVSAAIAATGQKVEANGLKLDLDGSSLTGTARWSDSGTGGRAKVSADLSAKALDLVSLPNAAALRGTASPFDLDLRLAADAIKVSRVGDGALETGRLSLAVAKDASGTTLKALHIVDFGGATLEANGTLDQAGAALNLTLDAAKLDQVAALWKQLSPGDIADAVAARAAALEPAKLALHAQFVPAPSDALKPVRVALDGHLGGTSIDARLDPDESQQDAVSLKATMQAGDGRNLLRQLGVAKDPTADIGPARVTLAAHGPTDQLLDTNLQASLGATRLDIGGRFTLKDASSTVGRLDGTGHATLHSPDLVPLLRGFGIASSDTADKLPAEVSGGIAFGPAGIDLGDLRGKLADDAFTGRLGWKNDPGDAPPLSGSLAIDRLALTDLVGVAFGPAQPAAADARWSDQPFKPPLLALPRCAIAMTGKVLELTGRLHAQDASFDLAAGPDGVSLKNLHGRFNGGNLTSSLTLRRDGRQATLEGSVAVDRVHVDLPSLNAVMTAKLDLAGSGTSALALVSNLAGSGDATLTEASVPGAGPRALRKIFDDVEDDALAVDDESIDRALDAAPNAALDAGTRHFRLGLATGALNAEATDRDPPPTDGVTSVLSASLDLRRLRYDEHIQQTLRALPKNWSGEPPSIVITLSGPFDAPRRFFDAPRRFFDAGGFVNAAAARAIARESARIEAYEFDVRERALFNTRLQSERLRERDRRQADADATAAAEAAHRAALDAIRRAEAERRARAEAARLERQHQDDAAKPPEPPTGASPGSSGPPTSAPRFEAPKAGATTDPSASGRY